MRVRTGLTRDRDLGDSQTMTPMIDIVFLLLVFFVCVASDQVIEHNLPTELHSGGVESTVSVPEESWITEVRLNLTQPDPDRPAVIEMNSRTFTDYQEFQQTLLALADISRDSPVILDIADAVNMRDVIQVYDACRGAEFTSINFAMKKSELKPPR